MPDADDATPAPLPRRPVDEQVLSVLREEAAREAEVRRKAAVPPAPALPATAKEESPAPPAEPDSSAAAEAPVAEANEPPPSAARPRAWEPEPGPVEMPVNRALGEFDGDARRRGFRTGFVCGLLLIAALVALYMVGPDLSDDVPSLAPGIARYVETVDIARDWLDGVVRSAMQSFGG